MQSTKIVWSLEGESLRNHPPEKIVNYPFQALRIIYSKEHSESILNFLSQYNKLKEENESGSYKPIIIDLSHKAQATIVGLKEPLALKDLSELTLHKEESFGPVRVHTENWNDLFEENKLIYLHNGNVILRVKKIEKDLILTSILQGKEISIGMEMTFPSSKSTASIFDLAYIDIRSFLEHPIDYVILPGLSSTREISIIQKKLRAQTENPPSLLLKVDSKEVYESLHEILPHISGVMVSRRALALREDPATVPLLSKEIIQEANKQAKIVLVSSEMLYSMKESPTPTRAEVSDLANAVTDGTDAVVLSKELTHGHNVLRALRVAERIIQEAETIPQNALNWDKDKALINNELTSLAYYACLTAERVGAKALVCLTKEGNTARQIASYRPSIPIVALTFDHRTKARISLIRGVRSIVLQGEPVLDKVLPTVNELLKRKSSLKTGDLFVFVTLSLSPISGEASNLFTVQEIS